MSVEYVHVGAHADVLSSGRPVGPGDRVQADELGAEDAHFTADGGPLVDIVTFGAPATPTATPEGADS